MCTIPVANVRTMIVNNKPATARGTAIAIADVTPALPWPPSTKIIADAIDAKQHRVQQRHQR